MSPRLSIIVASFLAVSGGLGVGAGNVAAAEARPATLSFNEHIQPILLMPPPEAHKSLKLAEVALLRQWIKDGAPYEKHWAFLKPERPPTPPPARLGWARNAIDAFVLEKLGREGLSPAPEADPYALIRRVSFDLTGLAPTPAETFELYGPKSRSPGTFAHNCLLARLMAARGVRFSQIFHRGWDHHSKLPEKLPKLCEDIDQPCYALHQLGLDHNRLTFRFQGLDQKLTGTNPAHVVRGLIA
jgi:hypothetical protein